MEKTKLKSKVYCTSLNLMAALFSLLLLSGLFSSHSWAASAAPDIKVNGMGDLTTLKTTSTLTATIQLDAGEQAGENADWWIAAETPVGWFYYQYPDGWHTLVNGIKGIAPAYQGPLVSLTDPLEILRVAGLPVGAYTFYFGVDTKVNGLVDAGFYDWLTFEVVDTGQTTCNDDEEVTSVDLTYPIVDTNQGFCYDNSDLIDCPAKGENFYGQDAQYTGNVPSYTDNGDGTVTGNVTGLMWTQAISTYAMPWSDASSYCKSLNTGGYTDWRLPTVKELWSIRDFSQGFPWVDTDYFYLVGDGSVLAEHHSWTSNPYLVESEYQNEQVIGDPAFVVNDWTGHIKAMSGKRFVRCVRGNTSYGINDFVDNGDDTVTDNATGLMWSKDDSGVAMNWEEALAYAENATIAGYDDWRLPSIKELQSIADYSGVFPAMDTSVFNLTEITNIVYDPQTGEQIDTQVNYPFYWSSTSNPLDPTVAWFLASGYNTDPNGYDLHGAGSICFDRKSRGNYVRLVRGGDVTETPDGDPSCVNPDRVVVFPDGDTGQSGGGGNTPPINEGGPDFSPGVEYLATIGITVTEENLRAIIGGPPAPTASELVANFAAYDATIVITEVQAQALLDTLDLP